MSKLDDPMSKEAVEHYYDSVAEDWDASFGVDRQNPYFSKQLKKELSGIFAAGGNAETALELGAGTGAYIDLVAPRFAKVVATDLSAEMLAVMQRRIEALKLTNVTTLKVDACDLKDLGNESFDVVYSAGLLETITNLNEHLAECRRVLKPGGTYCGITSNADCPWYAVRWMLQRGSRHCRTRNMVNPSRLESALTGLGFEDVRFKVWGAVPPGLASVFLARLLVGIESIAIHTPLRRYLGVLSFGARKAAA